LQVVVLVTVFAAAVTALPFSAAVTGFVAAAAVHIIAKQ